MKKNYSEPTVEAVMLSNIDVICTSVDPDGDTTTSTTLKTDVAGNAGTSYGAQNVSIYD